MQPPNKLERKKPYCQCDPNCLGKPLEGKPFCSYHLKKGCPNRSPLTGSEPRYEPDKYNKNPIRTIHNCFAYAYNIYEKPPANVCKDKEDCPIPYPQPGYYAGYPKWSQQKNKSCFDMWARLKGDNPDIMLTDFKSQCPKGTSKIAFVVDPKRDYHFYRQDSNGKWSDKHGAMPVTNKDADGKPIYNPALANRNYTDSNPHLNYTDFCGFVCIARNKPLKSKRGGGKLIKLTKRTKLLKTRKAKKTRRH